MLVDRISTAVSYFANAAPSIKSIAEKVASRVSSTARQMFDIHDPRYCFRPENSSELFRLWCLNDNFAYSLFKKTVANCSAVELADEICDITFKHVQTYGDKSP